MSAAALIETLLESGLTIATAESLTGGLVSAELVSIPGASAVVRGGVVAYSADVKVDVLGVPGDLVAARGTIDPDVAIAMARGVAHTLSADVVIATTGNAGPEASDGQPVGRVWLAVLTPAGVSAHQLDLPGDRQDVRTEAVRQAMSVTLARLREEVGTHLR